MVAMMKIPNFLRLDRVRRGSCATLFALVAVLAGCDLDVQNPNAPEESEVLGSGSGVVALAVGMQDQFALNIEEFIQAPALVTDEWGTGVRSLISYRSLLLGRDVVDELGVVEEPWASAYFVIRSANNLIASAGNVGLDPGLATGIQALAKLYKAMSLGTIIQQYEAVPIQPGGSTQPREVVLDTVLVLLESARGDLGGANLSLLRTRVLAGGIDLPNTVNAMLARYYLIDGQYQNAATAAERVDLGARSRLLYSGDDANPIWRLSVGLQYVFPLASFVADAEPGDQRPEYWTTAGPFFGGEPDSLLVALEQYSDRNDPYPIYIPDEMRLIRAEALTRLGRLAEARTLVNEVRTQCTDGPEPRACLPALPPSSLDTEAELLSQIAYERAYELYMQGLRWEDLRRLDQYIDVEPSIDWLPIPRQECQNNTNITCPTAS